jgi:hypothetical protein
VFVRHYPQLLAPLSARPELGLALCAIDLRGDRPAGTLWLPARAGRASAAIIGRHERADLCLRGHDVALRHLAVLVEPQEAAVPGLAPRFRVLDLCSPARFQGECGRSFEAVVTGGPLLLRCGGHALFCLPTGPEQCWPVCPEAAWAGLPGRVFVDERAGTTGPAVLRLPPQAGPARCESLVSIVPGPALGRAPLLRAGERPVGTLAMQVGAVAQRWTVGPEAARAGILLGRREHVDTGSLGLVPRDSVSRVHLLLIQLGRSLVALDTASTNGTWNERGALVHLTPLAAGATLQLGEDDDVRVQFWPH